MVVLAVAGAGHFEARAAVLTGNCCERDFFCAHGTFFGCDSMAIPFIAYLFND